MPDLKTGRTNISTATSRTDATEGPQTQSGTMRLHLVLPVTKAQSVRLPISVVAGHGIYTPSQLTAESVKMSLAGTAFHRPTSAKLTLTIGQCLDTMVGVRRTKGRVHQQLTH